MTRYNCGNVSSLPGQPVIMFVITSVSGSSDALNGGGVTGYDCGNVGALD